MVEPTPGDPPLQRGEVVCFGDGKTGFITRAYAMEDKFAVKALGSNAEIRGPNGAFFYFKRSELERTVPVPGPMQQAPEINGEPAAKRAAIGTDSTNKEAAPPAAPGDPSRLEGRVKWYSKEKGFGKIEPLGAKNGSPEDDAFVHKKQMDGGPDGPHAEAMAEGIVVTYDLIQLDGKPCASNVQVQAVARALAKADLTRNDATQSAEITRLLAKGLQVGNHQITGYQKAQNEDRFISRVGMPVENLSANCKKALIALFGVFDGHSGAHCSECVAAGLDKAIFDCIRHRGIRDQGGKEVTSDVAVKSALQSAFRTMEHNFFQYVNKLEGGAASAWATAGSTACTCTLFGPDEDNRLRLAVANAGDSRCVLGKRDGRAVRLSQDHTPDVPAERKRIEQAGASVVEIHNIWRIVLPNRRGTGVAGLSVSRGFGDLEYKQPAAIVSAVPDIFTRSIDLAEDCFIIIGSDGIWGSIEDKEAVQIVANTIRAGGDDPARNAAQQLTEISHQRLNYDDKTALVIWFGQFPDAPPVVASTPQQRVAAGLAAAGIGAHPRLPGVSRAPGADDMFASLKEKPKADLADLDNLFATFQKELGH